MKDYLLLKELLPPNAATGLYQRRKSLLLLFLFLIYAGFSAFAQQRTITGRVMSADSAVAGVTVQVKGTTTSTQTDDNGRFSITAPANGTLVFSSVGYGMREVRLDNRSTLDVQMERTAGNLNEVVVVGYGTQRKATVTGSVAAVKGAELDKSPVLNLSNSLAGRLPGITAIQSSGEPGYDGSTIRIRGTNTLGNSSPLIVIDGVPDRAGGLDRLNPADIETMSVLKDASAAIYGARAANGVILITTKQGRAGKPVVSYDFNQGWAQPTRIPALSNSAQYAELLNEQILFKDVPDPNQWGAAWQAFNTTGSYNIPGSNRTVRAKYSPEDLQKFRDGSSPLTHPNSDWFGSTLKTWSPQQQHNVQVSGGSENVRFLSSIGYQNQDAFYKNSATGYKQYDFRVNLDAKVSQYISTSLGILGREEFRFFPTRGAGSIFRMLMRGKPTDVAIWPNGLPGPDIENGENPVVITTNQTGYDRDRRHFFQTNGELVIRNPWIEGLKFTLQGAADRMIRRTKRWETPWYLYTWDNQTQFEADGSPKLTRNRKGPQDPRLQQGDENELRINLTGLINYDHKFNDVHTINLLAGVQKETREGDNFFAFRRYFISPAVDQLFAGGAQEQNTGGGAFQQARLSYFGRVNYNYREKYLAEFVWRYDGSYIFPEDKRFGFFPGVLVGWNISREDFFKNVTIFNNLKLRASYGQMGNDRLNFADYAYMSTYGLGQQVVNGQVVRTLFEPRVPNLNFTWEVANNANLGLEGTMLNNRLSFEFDVFNNQRKQILIARTGSTPQSTGMSSLLPPVNEGQVENKGWEFRIGYNGVVNRDFTFNVSVNGGYARNRVLFWDESSGAPDYQRSTGKSFGTSGFNFLSFKYDGVFRDVAEITANKLDYSAVTSQLKPGDMKFEDVNGDGKIDGLDAVRLDKNRDPRFTGGLNLNLQYKNFDLSALFQGAAGGLLLLNIHETGDFGNYPLFQYNERWSVNNPNSEHPRLASRGNTYYTNNGSFYGNNTYWLRNNDYIRLKNVEIGYNLGSNIAQRVGLSRLRVYAQALNLITWDKMGVFDPESTSSNAYYYPQSRIISTGVRVTF